MICPKCSNQIPDSSKFCPECGHHLPASSDSSLVEKDRSNLLQKYIPSELAKRIISAGKQIESERRLVTILFADVTGFTAMSEKLDPEIVSDVLNDCFKGLISIVYKYEGVIDKFIGDEIMAIFGAPIAHENDPERAVRCAKEMLEYINRFNTLSPIALPVPLGLHIGMNTGMVVAGNVGSDLRMNYSVIGDTVNLASRLVDGADKGEIVISDDTFRNVSSLIDTEEPKFIEVKGKTEPVKVYKVLSLKSDIDPGTRILQESSIVGREAEIAVLKTALERVVSKKEQRVFIRGEAGVGKTRLKLELIKLAKSLGVVVFEGKCSSFELNTPYYLWTTLLKSILQLSPDAGESETKKSLHDILQILSLEKHEPYLATLLSLRYEEILLEEDKERKHRIYEGLKELIRALAKRRVSVFLLEDVHWIDKFSQDLLDYLTSGQDLAPAMFVPLFRDEYIQAKGLIAKGGELIDLNRLPISDALKLMCLRLAVDEVPLNLADVLYKRSEGNPFFIEELVKTLIDKNVVSVKKRKLNIVQRDFESALPGTVQGVIMARIDRLEERLKDVLFSASVIGREFNKQLLKEILKQAEKVDPSLKDLVSLELVLEKEEAKEFAYLFKHYLIQEVAYNTILQKKRKEIHALIAKAIEKIYADKLKEFYEILAFHYERAEEWEKAADYLSRAGRKVGEAFSKDESQNFFVRKDQAMEKLFSSGRGRRGLLGIFSGFMGIISIAVGVLFWALTINCITFLITGYPIKPLESPLSKGEVLTSYSALFLLLDAILIAFFGYLSIRVSRIFMRGTPRLYELLSDQIRIHFSAKKVLTIPFGDIEIIGFLKNPKSDHKGIWGNLKQLKDFHNSYPQLLLNCLRYTVGRFSARFNFLKGSDLIQPERLIFATKGGEIHIRRKTGATGFLFRFSAGTKRDIALTPSHPGEFYEQLDIALKKWKRSNGIQVFEEKETGKDRGQPLLHLKPNIGSIFGMMSVNSMVIIMCFFIAFVGTIANLNLHQLGPIILISLVSLFYVIFPFVILHKFRIKTIQFYNAVEYKIYKNCIEYGFPERDWRRLWFNEIVSFELLQSRYQKRRNSGTIKIRTNKAVIQFASNLGTCEYIPDIEKAPEVLVELNNLLKQAREANIKNQI
ncbi:MAG: adenylate/guanylate cyclase domain-containing protein [Bacteroidota bacterium]